MPKTSKSEIVSKQRLQVPGKAALSDAQLEATRGGTGCAAGSHYPGGIIGVRR